MMKALAILAAASLALSPMAASAGSDTASIGGASNVSSADSTNSRPISGPLAGRALQDSAVPVGIIAAGAIFLLGGLAVAALAGGGGSRSTNSTSSTNTTN